jgi:hypothetical protein
MFRSGFLFDANAVFQLHYFCPMSPPGPTPASLHTRVTGTASPFFLFLPTHATQGLKRE